MSCNEIYSVATKMFPTTKLFFHHFVISFKKRQLKLDEIISPWLYTAGGVEIWGITKSSVWMKVCNENSNQSK